MRVVADRPSTILIPVDDDRVDQLVMIARDLAGIVLILDAAATGDPTLAAVARFLAPINEQFQEFKNWFHHALRLAMAAAREGK
jgi:hypothetical protein